MVCVFVLVVFLFWSCFKAFPKGSPLVPYISRAILNVTEDPKKMQEMELKYFSGQTNYQDSGSATSANANSRSLRFYCFGGLFIIMAFASVLSCFIHLVKFLQHRDLPALQLESSLRSNTLRDINSPHLGTESNISRDDHEAAMLANVGDHLQSHSTYYSTREEELFPTNDEDQRDREN